MTTWTVYMSAFLFQELESLYKETQRIYNWNQILSKACNLKQFTKGSFL